MIATESPAKRIAKPAPASIADLRNQPGQAGLHPATSFAISAPQDMARRTSRRHFPVAACVIPGSSVVEQAAVNRSVVGSSPTLGATALQSLATYRLKTAASERSLIEICQAGRCGCLNRSASETARRTWLHQDRPDAVKRTTGPSRSRETFCSPWKPAAAMPRRDARFSARQ